jgi:hypothetical protein
VSTSVQHLEPERAFAIAGGMAAAGARGALGAEVELTAHSETARAAREALGRPLGSHLLTAGPVVWNG